MLPALGKGSWHLEPAGRMGLVVGIGFLQRVCVGSKEKGGGAEVQETNAAEEQEAHGMGETLCRIPAMSHAETREPGLPQDAIKV